MYICVCGGVCVLWKLARKKGMEKRLFVVPFYILGVLGLRDLLLTSKSWMKCAQEGDGQMLRGIRWDKSWNVSNSFKKKKVILDLRKSSFDGLYAGPGVDWDGLER